MSHPHLNTAFNLEKFLIPAEKWTDELLGKVPEVFEKELRGEENSGPIGIAYVPDWGYCVLMAGQGPFVAWSEFDLDEYTNEAL